MSSAIDQLRVAHHLALRARVVSDFDAGALIRCWPALTAAAYATHHHVAGNSEGHDRVIKRIALDARSLDHTLLRLTWPGPGPRDTALLQVTAALTAAARTETSTTAAAGEVSEANRLIASTLWTTSQLIGQAARDHSYDSAHGITPAPSTELAATAKDMYRRFNAVEQLAAGMLRSLGSDSTAIVTGHELRRAVATWDVQAHRALLSSRSTVVLHVLAHLEAESLRAFARFVERANEAHIIDDVTSIRLRPILHDAATSWEVLKETTTDLSFGNTVVPTPFIDAARDLQTRFTDAAHDSDAANHPAILHAISGHLSSSVTIAASTLDLIEAGELRAPARALARLITQRASARSGSDDFPVDPMAIFRGLTVPLDLGTLQVLHATARRVFVDASEAIDRASALDTPHTAHSAFERRQLEGAESTRGLPRVHLTPGL